MAVTLAGGAVLTAYLTSVAITKGASGTYTGLKKALFDCLRMGSYPAACDD